MKRLILALVAACSAFPQNDDTVLRAMRDELERSRKLAIANLEQPYYIEYTLDDLVAYSVTASLGAIIAENENRARVPRARVRVGTYEFDNTNYVLTDLFGAGNDQLVIDNDYNVLRRGWWLMTDRAYKGALEAIARKRASLKNMSQPETLADFWKADPVQKVEPAPLKTGGWGPWRDRIRSLSAVFTGYPEAVSSTVSLTATRAAFYLHNSEGTTLRRPEPLATFQVQAFGYAPDGTVVRDSVSLTRSDEAAIPPDSELRSIVSSVADNVKALVKAPAGESYSGPVMFEGLAGAQIMAELLVPNLGATRRPIADAGRPAPYQPSEFEGRLESRVMPEFLNVVDDPTQKTWNGVPLGGYYEMDEEGAVPKPLTVIDKGRFKTFLLTRQPIRGFERSNGRARMPGAFGARSASPTNLFIRSSESVSAADLKARLLKMVADRNKPYGIIVRKMDFPSSAPMDEVRRMMMAAGQSGATRIISSPVLVYRVYPDGREELVRGVRFRGLSARSLRDIAAVSDNLNALHYLHNLAPMALQGAGGYVAPVSVISPSILFDELELERPRDDVPKLPVVPPPPLTARN